MANPRKIGRLAFRHEGDHWRAYYAEQGTMDEAVFLGSIPMVAAEKPERKEAFITLMREIVGDLIEAEMGREVSWGDPYVAPEHERAGHG